VAAFLLACGQMGIAGYVVAGEAPERPKLVPVDPKVIAAREKALAEQAPEGAKLAGYLDCGSQWESSTDGAVKIALAQGKPYRFQSEAKGVEPTQPSVFFHEREVAFTLSGIDRAKRYRVSLVWWDYDNGSRTHAVLVGSPDLRRVRLAVPAIRLPNYTTDEQPPAQKQFSLPATFARQGAMRLAVRNVTGSNAVVSELWIWQMD
jgi:hypothetical protein